MHKAFRKVCRLLHLTVAWAQQGVIKGSRAHPARQAAQGTGLTQWFSPALSAGYGGSLHEDVQGRARGSTHRLSEMCLQYLKGSTFRILRMNVLVISRLFASAQCDQHRFSRARWFVVEHRTAGCPHPRPLGTQSSAHRALLLQSPR